jgi:hypothetical protein
MAEPLFFDCLTDAQIWALFDSRVLQSYRLPQGVYERLERIAPAQGCYLFTWPIGAELPPLHDMIPGLAAPGEQPSVQDRSDPLRTHEIDASMRSVIEAIYTRIRTDRPPVGRRIYMIATYPRTELRAGPCLELQARDLSAMSLDELEAYLDDLLRLDDAAEDAGER